MTKIEKITNTGYVFEICKVVNKDAQSQQNWRNLAEKEKFVPIFCNKEDYKKYSKEGLGQLLQRGVSILEEILNDED